MSWNVVRSLAIAAVVVGLGTSVSFAQSIGFSSNAFAGVPGATVTVPIQVTSDVAVTGASFGVSHTAPLTLESVTRAAAFNTILGGEPNADFYLVDTELETGNGFVVAFILPPGNGAAVIPAGTTRLFDARYAIAGDAAGTTDITITSTLVPNPGTPATSLVVDVASGDARSFDGSTATVTFVEGFRRGDADGNGRLELTDAVRILAFLFQGDTRSDGCLVSLNADGVTGANGVEDRNDIQLNDAILIVAFLFQRSGRPPAAPYPDCGESLQPIDPNAACTVPNCN